MPDISKSKGQNRNPDSVSKFVGARIRQRRDIMGYSQAQLAEACGITFQQIQKYENGKNRVSVGRLYLLSELLGVPIGYFFEGVAGSGKEKEAAANDVVMEAESLKGELLQLVRAYYHIPNIKVRRRILDLALSLQELPRITKT